MQFSPLSNWCTLSLVLFLSSLSPTVLPSKTEHGISAKQFHPHLLGYECAKNDILPYFNLNLVPEKTILMRIYFQKFWQIALSWKTMQISRYDSFCTNQLSFSLRIQIISRRKRIFTNPRKWQFFTLSIILICLDLARVKKLIPMNFIKMTQGGKIWFDTVRL